MEFTSPEDLTTRAGRLGGGPVLIVLCEDAAEIAGTLAHHAQLGFRDIVLALPPGVPDPDGAPEGTHLLRLARRPEDMAEPCVNALLAGRPDGAWTAWCYNAEYLMTPFCETRRIGEALAFCAEERRDAVATTVVDLYPADLKAHPTGLAPEAPMLDARGYYALGRWDPETETHPERQLDLHGGLRRRFEEHVPWTATRRRIDRTSILRARPGVRLRPDHLVTEPEMNTRDCPWHRSLSACVTSWRAAKALATNPGPRAAVDGLTWPGSAPYEGTSRQLMELGLMEPGQWF